MLTLVGGTEGNISSEYFCLNCKTSSQSWLGNRQSQYVGQWTVTWSLLLIAKISKDTGKRKETWQRKAIWDPRMRKSEWRSYMRSLVPFLSTSKRGFLSFDHCIIYFARCLQRQLKEGFIWAHNLRTPSIMWGNQGVGVVRQLLVPHPETKSKARWLLISSYCLPQDHKPWASVTHI